LTNTVIEESQYGNGTVITTVPFMSSPLKTERSISADPKSSGALDANTFKLAGDGNFNQK
jgi:hypothetical protein